MFHPWGALRGLAHVIIIWARPAPGVPAATDGERRIWIDPRMGQRERRCALSHELVHLEAGHRGCQPGGVEAWVRGEAARRLIDLDRLASTLLWSQDLREVADELWVTELVLADRMAALSPTEHHYLEVLWAAAQG
ncbi:ImmA/IrrE family metallo-endopeptidase [Arthrobacter sp.]|uniref:ImmA/IrrE family metallo-endopeptidase n=1 Tax=Arthrobacter sp. TaxID=1667 RepID=UPI003A8CF55A